MGKTIVTVMHDLHFALSCSDRVAVMEQGRITAFDTAAAIAGGDALALALGVDAIFCEEAKQYFFNKRNGAKTCQK